MTLKFNFTVKDLGIKEDKKASAAKVSKLCKAWKPTKVSLEAIRDEITNNFAKYLITTVVGIGEMLYQEKCTPKP